MKWIFDNDTEYRELVKENCVYEDVYASKEDFAYASRLTKLVTAAEFIRAEGGRAAALQSHADLPPSLIRDLDAYAEDESGGDAADTEGVPLASLEERWPTADDIPSGVSTHTRGGGGGGRGGGACWSCGEYGHYAAECDQEWDGYAYDSDRSSYDVDSDRSY